MGTSGAPKRDWKQSIRPALILSLIFGVVAGGVVTIASAGGTNNGLNFNLGGIAFLIAFVAGLLVISLLMMVVNENPKEMGLGSGVNRSSEHTDEELDVLEGRAPKPAPAAPVREDAVPDAASPAEGAPVADAGVTDAAAQPADQAAEAAQRATTQGAAAAEGEARA